MTLLQRDRENIELGREEGREEGFQEGRQIGIKMALDIIRLHLDGKEAQEIADQLGLEADFVNQVLEDYAGLPG
ncbi:MAG TPA: hypothetical protein H9717_01560 [Candidatus Eisenbergiella merdipullorum]|uniref:Flagellar assembly protein H n=1 Tax=Candidatus Eisenbergiella merdipullorum TaxID=2838553 RepID=A0A9D2KZV4_9FIRM|nr:hypothetical protein [Candidatus Eisenbergiella merdipullorum]